MKKLVLCDIDGTIADISHRLHYIQKNPKDWDSFYNNVIFDKPIRNIIELVELLHDDMDIVFVSGRRASTLLDTARWIRLHVAVDNVVLYTRKDGDCREDYIIKKELLDQIKKDFPNHEIFLALDDRNQVVKMWRDNGITCLQVKEGDY